jgi:hypothetical protein
VIDFTAPCSCYCPAIISVGGMMFMMTAWIVGIVFGYGFREITDLAWRTIRRGK